MFPWYLQYSWSDLQSFPFYYFPLFLCICHWGKLSYLSLLFSGTLHSDGYIFPFLFCLLLLFYSQLFIRLPQTAIIQKKFLHCCKSSRAHNRLPNLGIWPRDWEPPWNLTLKASGIWLQNFHRTRKQTLGGHRQNLVGTRTQEKGVSPQETGPYLPVSVQESPAEVWVDSGLRWGQEHWIHQSWEPWQAGKIFFEGGCHYHH